MTKEELEKIKGIDFKKILEGEGSHSEAVAKMDEISTKIQADIAYQLTQANEHRAILNGELRLIRSQLTRIADALENDIRFVGHDERLDAIGKEVK
jgi:hypothetical protein